MPVPIASESAAVSSTRSPGMRLASAPINGIGWPVVRLRVNGGKVVKNGIDVTSGTLMSASFVLGAPKARPFIAAVYKEANTAGEYTAVPEPSCEAGYRTSLAPYSNDTKVGPSPIACCRISPRPRWITGNRPRL